MRERAEWAAFGSIVTTPIGGGRSMIMATCHICHWARRRRTHKGARRALRRHWMAIQGEQSDGPVVVCVECGDAVSERRAVTYSDGYRHAFCAPEPATPRMV